MNRYIHHLFQFVVPRTLAQTGTLFIGNGIASLLAVVFTLVVARGLEPEKWGIVVTVISVVIIGEALGDLGLGASLYKFFSKNLSDGNAKKAREIWSVAFLLRCSSIGLGFFILWGSSSFLSPLLFATDDSFLLSIAALGIFSYLLFDFQISSMQARGKWAASAFFIGLVNLFRLGSVFSLLFTHSLTVESVLYSYSLAPLVTLLFTFYIQPIYMVRVSQWAKIAREILSFSSWLGLNRAASAVGARIDVVLLFELLGRHEAGIYGAAKQLAVGVPILIGSLASVLAPKFSSTHRENILTYFKKTVLLAFGLSLGLVLGIAIAPFVTMFFGPKYQESLPILQWLFVGYIPFIMATPAVNLLIYAFHKPKIIGILSLAQVPLILFLTSYLIPLYGVWGAVIIHILWNSSTLIVAYVFVGYYLLRTSRKL